LTATKLESESTKKSRKVFQSMQDSECVGETREIVNNRQTDRERKIKKEREKERKKKEETNEKERKFLNQC